MIDKYKQMVQNKFTVAGVFIVFLLIWFVNLSVVHAGLSPISDLVMSPGPNEYGDHLITFTPSLDIPAGGHIDIDFSGGSFDVPSLQHEDVDIAVDGVDLAVAASPSGSTVGVRSLIVGPGGDIRLTLGSDKISASSEVTIEIGLNARYQANGSSVIKNPASSGAYILNVLTRNSSGVAIESTRTLAVVTDPISVTVNIGEESEEVVEESPVAPSGGGGGGGGSAGCFQMGDVTNDCLVDLVDFSTAAFWYKRVLTNQEFAAREQLHLNGDGRIDLVDFSIMAFYYTGSTR